MKSDATLIPVYLWNKRVEGFESVEQRDKLLFGFRRFGMLLFLMALWRDLACYLVETYRENWCEQPRKRVESLIPLGGDHVAMTNIIWHTTHSNWFEFHVGSRVVGLCFLL